jgi:hypothetical protein
MGRGSQEYQQLAQTLQETSPFRLWISVLKFPGNILNPLSLESYVTEALAGARAKGFAGLNEKGIFLAGHSLGGIFARNLAPKYRFGGFILLGSYLERSEQGQNSLKNFPVPVLTLGAELDGLTRVTRIALESAALIKAKQATGTNVTTNKPVIIIKGMNHSQIANGELQKGDLNPEISHEEAIRAMASSIVSFLNVHRGWIQADLTLLEKSKADLESKVLETEKLVAPFLNSLSLQETWCEKSQLQVAFDLESKEKISIKSQIEENLFAFAQSKPALRRIEGEKVQVSQVSYVETESNPLDLSITPVSAKSLACKMKNQESLAKALNNPFPNSQPSCALLNQRAFEDAWKILPEAAKARYLSNGKTIQFAPDRETLTGISWLASSIEWNEQGPKATLTSPALNTDLNAPFGLDGMFYCKLWSPARAMEWLMLDSLRSR